jgi:hypothetical protein
MNMLDGTKRAIERHDHADPRHNRVLNVEIGDGAAMSVPTGYWCWRLRYAKDTTPPGVCDDRMIAAGVCDSYRYLIMECNKEEAWRRVKLMREAIIASRPIEAAAE